MSHKAGIQFKTLVFLFLAVVLVVSCAPQAPQQAAPTQAPNVKPTESEVVSPPQELKVVQVAITPFYEFHHLTAADELGWDKELGLDLQLNWVTQAGPVVEGLVNGSFDVGSTCVVCNFPFYESVPDLMNFYVTDQFKGFIIIGRKGKAKPYSEFLEELGDPEKAKIATIKQMKGSTWPIYQAHYEPMVKGLLEQAGMTIDEVKIINFADDEKSALAMIGGTGDYYMGGLPAEINLLKNHPDKFINVGGPEVLGPYGLWYSNIGAMKSWLDENEDTALKLMALNYRYARYVYEKIDVVAPIVMRNMNEHSGGNLTVEDVKFIIPQFSDPRPYQEEIEKTFNPDSPLYWGKSAEYYVKTSTELPPNADWRRNNPLDEWFKKFLERKDLLEWVDRPLE